MQGEARESRRGSQPWAGWHRGAHGCRHGALPQEGSGGSGGPRWSLSPKRAPSQVGTWPHGRAAPPQSSHPGATGPTAGTGRQQVPPCCPIAPALVPLWEPGSGTVPTLYPHTSTHQHGAAHRHTGPRTGTRPHSPAPSEAHPDPCKPPPGTGSGRRGDSGSVTVGTEAIEWWGWQQCHGGDGGSVMVGTEAVARWGQRQWRGRDGGSGTVRWHGGYGGRQGRRLQSGTGTCRHTRSAPGCVWHVQAQCVQNHLHGRCACPAVPVCASAGVHHVAWAACWAAEPQPASPGAALSVRAGAGTVCLGTCPEGRAVR